MGRAHSGNNEEGGVNVAIVSGTGYLSEGPLVRMSAGSKIEVGLFVLIRISCTNKRVKHFIFSIFFLNMDRGLFVSGERVHTVSLLFK